MSTKIDYETLTKYFHCYITLTIESEELKNSLPHYYNKCKKYILNNIIELEVVGTGGKVEVFVSVQNTMKTHKVSKLRTVQTINNFIETINRVNYKITSSVHYNAY